MEMGQRGGSSLMDRGNGSVREPDDGGETSAEPFHIRWGTLRSAEYRSELAYRNRRGVFHRSISFVCQTDLSETPTSIRAICVPENAMASCAKTRPF